MIGILYKPNSQLCRTENIHSIMRSNSVVCCVQYKARFNFYNLDYSDRNNSRSLLWILTVACDGIIYTLPTAETSLRLARKLSSSSVRSSLIIGTVTLNSVAVLLKLSCLVTLV